MLTYPSTSGFKFAQIEMSTFAALEVVLWRLIARSTEVILSTLIANFTFELSDKPIFWNVSAITFPSAGKDSEKPEMWLKVGRYVSKE